MDDFKHKIANLYSSLLFETGFVDAKTGTVSTDNTRKFATFPYIGSKYGIGPRILIIGYDIGCDETPGRIQTFEERNNIETSSLRTKNPHIAGTFFTALYYLKDFLKINEFWENTKSAKYGRTFDSILRKAPNLPLENPLSYISMTNYFKYVTQNRGQKDSITGKILGRRGNFDRVFLNKENDIKLFLSEVEIFSPDIIFFQGKEFKFLIDSEIKNYFKSNNIKAYYAFHPSDFSEAGANIPDNYFRNRVFELD
ncbi:hypothetical protein [Epilithonimonas hominis]|uniref:hypothetical protein n=1 Tax=Epilithonimonas hominis TaxID=420404 RepID=UPI0028970100|nr:hypothetical protein [Epilithonimonas hominis]